MRGLVQRVREASVTVDGRAVSTIGRGLLVLIGVTDGDSDEDCDWLAHKLVNLRIFDDDIYYYQVFEPVLAALGVTKKELRRRNSLREIVAVVATPE